MATAKIDAVDVPPAVYYLLNAFITEETSMKTGLYNTLRPFGGTALLTLLCLLPLGAEEIDYPVLLHMEEPIFPLELPMEGVVEGSVNIAVDINEDGTVGDWMPLSASHRRFVDQVGDVIMKWKFKPAEQDGETVPCQMTYEINFTYSDVVQVTGINNPFFNIWSRLKAQHQFVYELSALDKLPSPIKIIRPYRMPEDTRGEWTGTVTFRFYIDKDGKVRMPVMTHLEGNLNIARSAAAALQEWEFEPPTIKGEAVVARAEQIFNYKKE